MNTPFRRFAFSALGLSLGLLLSVPEEGSARGPRCTDSYLECINDALDGGNTGGFWDFSDELGSVECGAGWAGCVLGRFRDG